MSSFPRHHLDGNEPPDVFGQPRPGKHEVNGVGAGRRTALTITCTQASQWPLERERVSRSNKTVVEKLPDLCKCMTML
jgi:hypothetical protein